MGVYDYVAKGDTILQIKCAENYLKCYQLGENINIPDGLYLAYEGAFVVDNGMITAIIDEKDIYNKWGGKIDNLEEILDRYNIIATYSNSYEAKSHFGLI